MKSILAHCLCATVFAAVAVSVPAAAQTNQISDQVPHRPMEAYRNPDGTFRRLRNTVETNSWSGYAVTAGAPYQSASATWQVPNVTYDGGSTPYGYEYVSNWVGLGGYGDATLIQLGTELVVSTGGATSFYTWYELYPAVAVSIGLNVRPGDTVTASLQCTAACSPSQTQTWQLSLSDKTAGSSWTESFQYELSMASADWITEPPYYNPPGFLPLADFGAVTYDPVMANGANPNLSLSANGIIAADPYGETSNPSAPVDGNDFSTCWGANGAGLTPCAAGTITPPSVSAPPPPPAPAPGNVTAQLTATPASVRAGQSSKLTWTSKNATKCTGVGFAAGTAVTGPFAWALVFPKVTTSYALVCADAAGDTATSMNTVTVK